MLTACLKGAKTKSSLLQSHLKVGESFDLGPISDPSLCPVSGSWYGMITLNETYSVEHIDPGVMTQFKKGQSVL